MEIYGLSGKSGTGKSYNASQLCSKMSIEALVDDGLLIRGTEIVAGFSAKKESTRLKAVRRAIFTDEDHRQAVAGAIKEMKPERLLVIGTSDDMIRLICEKLELPEPVRIIQIEEITTTAQRSIARKARDEGGIHVIPAPTFQVKKQFSGYFIDARKGFRKQKEELGDEKQGEETFERTVVRPTYSYMGEFVISDKVMGDIVNCVAKNIPGIDDILWVSSDNSDDGLYLRVILLFKYGCKVRQTAIRLQQEIYDAVSSMTAFNVLGVDIEARGLRK